MGIHLQGQTIPGTHERAGDGHVAYLRMGIQVVGRLAVVGAVQKAHHTPLGPGGEVVPQVTDNVGAQESGGDNGE